jgi:hypothetical protein
MTGTSEAPWRRSEAAPTGDRTPSAQPRSREGRNTTRGAEGTAPRLTREQSKGLEAAVRHLRDGPADRDAAIDAMTAAGFSKRKAEEIIAAIVAELIAAARREGQTRER